MQTIVYKNHDGEGSFPLFPKGTKVENILPCPPYEFWSSCTIDGYSTYIANSFISKGLLNRDYNPTELIASKGETVTILEIAFDWAYVQNDQGEKGWLPFRILISK